jgi:hypothetical protein
LKFRHQAFRVGNRVDSAGRLIDAAPTFDTILESDEPAKLQYVSRPHGEFLRSFGVPVREYPHAHGNGEVRMTHAMIEH